MVDGKPAGAGLGAEGNPVNLNFDFGGIAGNPAKTFTLNLGGAGNANALTGNLNILGAGNATLNTNTNGSIASGGPVINVNKDAKARKFQIKSRTNFVISQKFQKRPLMQKIFFSFLIFWSFVFALDSKRAKDTAATPTQTTTGAIKRDFWKNGLISIEADFVQITHQGSQKLIYTGKLYAKNPSLAKWIYETPLKKTIYLNKKEAIIYEPMLEQATFTHLTKQVDFFAILHKATLGQDGKYHAKVGDAQYVLSFAKNLPHKITFIDELQNKIEIILKNLKVNPTLSDGIFVFTPPNNIDIIEQ
ncbi:outer-membrane lipoprotein carrier protein precursor [Helicobacter mustelae]|nr:outer-membrane lipoprotein carrier protein precursor [Helicobacter mustelae]STP12755.1 outer-membrane lipoprotein carrier protein precursor [Helicobacter mustelae]